MSIAIFLLIWEQLEQFGFTAWRMETSAPPLVFLTILLVCRGVVWLRKHGKTRS
jgi:hypothetical protein